MDPITYRLTSLSFHAGHPIPGIWLLSFQFSTLEVQGQCHSSRSHNASNILSTHIHFPPCRLSHSWDTTFSKFDLENPRSKSRVRQKYKATEWVRLPIDSHPFCSMWIGHPILGIQLFRNLTLKIVQGNILGITPYRLTSISFHFNRPSQSWYKAISEFDLENLMSRAWVRWKIEVTQ